LARRGRHRQLIAAGGEPGRAALRSGGVDDAIRTYARRRYRFIPELVGGAADRSGGDDTTDVTEAKALFDSGSWTEAANAFERADSRRPLAAAELECWGIALQCAGTTPAAVEPFQRAATLLDGLALCEQHGHLAWMRSWLASYEGAPSRTLDHARETVDIGRQLGNSDLEAIGLLFWGIALQASGDAQRGLELQDEAGAVVLTGSVTPLLGGLVYCGLIGGCCNTGDWPRAGQWSESFSAWCRRNGVQRFSGSCLLHRVEVFVARGELDRAEDEIRQNDGILRMNGEWAIAAAQRFLGDIHFLRGEFQPAETAYRTAYEHGTDPHPGYALLLHRRGHSQAAIRALRRSAEGVTWESMERKPL